MKRFKFIICLLFGTLLLIQYGYAQDIKNDLNISRIYSDNNYNAFTSLIKFKGYYYCAFRSGEYHVYGRNGIIKILRSKNGLKWDILDSIYLKGYDLRDPKLSVDPTGRIAVIIGGSVYKGKELLGCQTHIAFSNKRGTKFSKPESLKLNLDKELKNFWLWRLSWYENKGYGVVYPIKEKPGPDNEGTLRLVGTSNGVDYNLIAELKIKGQPNECTIRVMPDGEMLILIRRERGNRKALLAKSQAPYKEWTYMEAPFFIGGPDFIPLNDNLLAGGGRINGKTGIISFDRNGNFKKIVDLPSNADSSYPGFVIEKDQLIISYYSSHETKKTAIYLAQIPLHYFK